MRSKSLGDLSAVKEQRRQQTLRQKVRVRGLRDVLAAEEIGGHPVPATQAQQLSAITWLEREAERLKREANIFEANLLRIRNRLADIDARRTLLLKAVRESLGIAHPDLGAQEQATAGEEQPDQAYLHTVSLNY